MRCVWLYACLFVDQVENAVLANARRDQRVRLRALAGGAGRAALSL